MRSATINDIARDAGVSSVTVSRVLNTPDLVKPDTRHRVEQSMRKLGYTPNLAARAMRTRATHTVGFLVPDILSYANAAVAQAAERSLAAEGYGMILVSSDYNRDRELRALEMLRTHRVDGCIIYPCDETDDRVLEAVRHLGIPCVALDRNFSDLTDTVLSNHADAMRDAVRYLIDLGHTSIALLLADLQVRPSFERRQAFEAVIDAAKLPRQRQKIVLVHPDELQRYQADELFEEDTVPTAVIVEGSRLLRSVVASIRQRNRRVPEDVSLVGLDVDDVATTMTPELTRVSRNYSDIGRVAVELMVQRIRSRSASRQSVILESTVLLKGSCAPGPQRQ